MILCIFFAVILGIVSSEPAYTQDCSHNGLSYRSGAKVKIGCDDCICNDGVISCPSEMKCPASCLFMGVRYEHTDQWESNCRKCHCHLGTAFCSGEKCETGCSWMGLQKEDGAEWESDCNDCRCVGNEIKCSNHTCYCPYTDAKGVKDVKLHGEGFQDGCATCTCFRGKVTCNGNTHCKKSCTIQTTEIESGSSKLFHEGCIEAICDDGDLTVNILRKAHCF